MSIAQRLRQLAAELAGDVPTPPAPTPPAPPAPAPPAPTPPAPPAGEGLLYEVAATLQKGEWRQVQTTLPAEFESFKAFQYVKAIPPATGGADGMGWTERLIEHNGTLMMLLMRDAFEKSLIVMDQQGTWRRQRQPEGLGIRYERRPFNRLFKQDGYMVFAPADSKVLMGYVVRTPLDNPGVFERDGISIGDDQMDTVGNFAMCAAWGRRWAYTPGGKLRSWAAGETAWKEHAAHIPKDQRNSGYAGTVIFNPVRNEVISLGGQTFGDNLDKSHTGLRVRHPDEPAERFEAVREDGTLFTGITSGSCRFTYHVRTGDYLMLYKDGVMYRSADGVVWRVYEDMNTLKPWGAWEQYIPWTQLGSTDVLVAVSHINGVWLHRLKD